MSARVVCVTGGTRGIGRGIADAFAAQGETVVVSGRQPRDDATVLTGDIRDPAVAEELVARVVARHGRLDVLVNNAGGAPPADTDAASPRFSEAIVRLNLIAPLVLSQHANRVMQAQGGGVIVNVASIAALRASPTAAAYGAAKAGLIQLTRTLAVEWAPRVRVVAVSPGLIATEQADRVYRDRAAVEATVPLGRLGTPADVAAAVIWLASDAAAYISGANLVLDGGGEWPAFLTRGDDR